MGRWMTQSVSRITVGYNNIRRSSVSGLPAFSNQEAGLPRIPNEFLDAAIYLYETKGAAEAGEDIGGSGFLVSRPVKGFEDREFAIAVTNRHVIEQGAPVIRLNRKDGGVTVLVRRRKDWIYHPDGIDIAICPIPLSTDTEQYRTIATAAFATKERLRELDIGIGDDVFAVGRFIHRDGTQRNVPTARFGHIAQMPSDILDEQGRTQESFLVEARSIGGYSGSAVFVHIPPLVLRPGSTELSMNFYGPFLLGIDWSHMLHRIPVLDSNGKELVGSRFGEHVGSNTGMMGVIPAWRLAEVLETPELVEMFRREEAALGAKLGLTPLRNLDPGSLNLDTRGDASGFLTMNMIPAKGED